MITHLAALMHIPPWVVWTCSISLGVLAYNLIGVCVGAVCVWTGFAIPNDQWKDQATPPMSVATIFWPIFLSILVSCGLFACLFCPALCLESYLVPPKTTKE